MRVLQISPVAPPHRSGMANAAGEIYKATKEAGAEAELVAAFGNSTIPGLRHYRIPGLGLFAFTPALIKLLKTAVEKSGPLILVREKVDQANKDKNERFDIVHLHYPCFGNALMVSLARRLGARQPLVVSYHMDTVGRGLRRPVFWFHQKFLAPHFLRQADKIVITSRDYAEHSLLAKYPDLMSKVVEIPFGIDTTRFYPSPASSPRSDLPSPRREEGRDAEGGAGRGNILFVGGLDEQHYFKGLHILLKALVKIPDAKLIVVGSGNLVKHYARMAHDLGIDERVIFAGRVSDEELPGYYRRADVFCSASLDRSEAYGIVLVEAAASGLPVVATDIPGVRTVVKNNETGLLVKPGDPVALADALNSILGDLQFATRLGKAGRTFALSRTWPDVGQKYLEVYGQILNTKN